MPDNKPKNIEQPLNIHPDYLSGKTTGTMDTFGKTGFISASFGNTDYGDSKYDIGDLSSEFILNNSYEQLRGERQGWGAELANAIGGGLAKIPLTVIGNVGSMLDFEDYANQDQEVGNWLTSWAEEVKGDIEGATKIYKSNENSLSSREWWLNNAKGLIDSAGAFALSGGALGKGVQILSNLMKGSEVIQGIGTVTNAAMLNQAESIPMAMNVYQKAIDLGKSEQEAADAAAYSIAINRINIPLNLTSAAAFLRPISATRQIVKDVNKKQVIGKLLSEGVQEYSEENINMIAEKEALRSAQEGNNYTYNFDNTVKDILSKEGFETGLIGFIGGVAQTGLTDAINILQKDSPSYNEDGNIRLNDNGSPVLVNTYKSQKERFKAQQNSLKNIELLSKTESLPTVQETLNNVKTTAIILNDIQEAIINNDNSKVESLKNDLLINQAISAFKNGTTDKLIQMYESLAKDPSSKDKFGQEYHAKTQEAIKQIEDLEKTYEQHSSLPQVGEIVANKAKFDFNLKQAEALQTEISKAQQNQQKEIQITGFTTPKQISSLSSTKDLQLLQVKAESIKDNIINLNNEYNTLTSPKYTKEASVRKEAQKVSEVTKVEDAFKEPVITETAVSNEDFLDESTPASNEEIVQYLGDKIINRKSGEQFTPEEQQYYENNKSAVEAYVASKAKPTTSNQSEIESKKADIERRRQEELETTKNIGEDKLKEGRENTKKIVESLKQRYPATSVQGIIIRILEKLIDFSKYSTIIDSEYINGRNASGQATWFGMMISQETLDGILAGKEFEVHTFIHEFIHGFTTSKISGYNIEKQGTIPGFKSNLTAKEKNAIEQLQRIFEKVKRDNPKSKEYGFTNLDEFIAEAFSNSGFQYTLKNTKAEGKKSNLFSEFINAIGDLLFEQLERWAKRFNKEIPDRSTITGILEDVLAWTEELIDQNNKLAYIATEEEINAKYDAELTALKQSEKSQVSSTENLTTKPDEIISNGVVNAFDESSDLDEKLDKNTQSLDKEFTSKKPNALMMKHFHFKQGTKTWERDSDGKVIPESTPDVSETVSKPDVAMIGSEATYVVNGEDIALVQNGITIGKLGLPHETTSTDPKVLLAREQLIKIREYVLSKPSGTIKTTILDKGKGKLLIKIKHNLPDLSQAISNRSQDMVDGNPLFLYDNGKSLTGFNLSKKQQDVVNQFEGTTYSVEDPNDSEKRLGIGKVFQVVKAANDSWAVIPIYTQLIGNINNSNEVKDSIIYSLASNISQDGLDINYDKLLVELNPIVFASNGNKFKNHNGVKVFASKDKTEIGRIEVAGEKFKFTDIKSGNPVTLENLKKALDSARFNLDMNSLNKAEYQEKLQANNVLVTNAYTDSNNNYYVQPYIEINNPEGYVEENLNIKETIEVVTPNNIESKEDNSLDILKFDTNKANELNQYNDSDDYAFSKTKLGGNPITEKSIKDLNKILPGLTVADAKLTEEVGKNMKDTYGMFHNMLIYLFNGATNQTLFHEAFHGVFRNILSETERIEILNEAKVKYDAPNNERLDFLRFGYGNELLNSEVLTQLHYEERLADDFGRYTDGEFNKSLGEKILDFFKKIFDLFNIFKNSNPTQTTKLFQEIVKGKYAKRSLGAKAFNIPLNYKNFGQAYVRVLNDISMAAELDRTKSISNQILNKISQEVAKGTPLNKINKRILARLVNEIKDDYGKQLLAEDFKQKNNDPSFNGGKLKVLYNVYHNYEALLTNISKQIKSTRNLNIDFSNLKDIKIEDIEGIQDTKDNEITSTMEGNETKGWKEMTSISGIKTATHEIKLFLSNIPVIKKDGTIDTDTYGFTKFHSFEEIYHTLEHTLIRTTTFNEQVQVLNDLAPYKPVLRQIVEAIESIKNPEIKDRFKKQFAANFNKQVLNYKLVTYKKVKDNFEFKIFNPNREGVEVALATQWSITNIADPSNNITDAIRDFNTEEGSYAVNIDKVKSLIESYKNKDLNVDGVFELANKLGIGLSHDTIEIFNNIPSVNKYTPLQNITRDLLNYASDKWIKNLQKDAHKTFDKLIKMELNAQTALFTSSFNNVENSSVYAIQYQSFASKLINKLSNDKEGLQLRKELERDVMFKNNFLFEKRHNLEIFPLDGLKMQGDMSEGKKFNQIDSNDYISMIINMFVNSQAESSTTKSLALYAPIIPAEKGLSFGYVYEKLNAPENLKNSPILQQFRQLTLNELARIKQVMKDIKTIPKEQLINNYHLGKKLGLEFNLTNAINSKLKQQLDKMLEDNLDSNKDLTLLLAENNLLSKIDEALINELEHVAKTEKQKLIDAEIVKEIDGKLTSDRIQSTDPLNTIDKIVRDWSLNSYLFNISSSLLINGDPAFYKGPADNGKRFYQGYSMLKFADTSVIDDSYKYLNGGKFKMNVIADVQVASESLQDLINLSNKIGNSKIKELVENNYSTKENGVGMINATDAQMFVSEAFYKELLKIFGQDSNKLSVFKPFSYGNQWNSTTKRYEPVQIKCSIFPLTDSYVAMNPLLAEHKKLMDADVNYPQVIGFESTMKALSPFRADISNPESTSIVEVDLNNFGEQVANPDHMLDSENGSLRQTKMLFFGMVENDTDYNGRLGKDIKAEIAALDKANIEESLQEIVEGFKSNKPELTKMIQEAITSRNATSVIEKVFQQNPDGTFQYPLDLISSKSTIQLISSIFSGNATRQKFRGGSAVQASAIGLQVPTKKWNEESINADPKLQKLRTSLRYIKAKDENSIDFCEAMAPAWMEEFVDENGNIKDNIPEDMKELLVYRIPTEGAHSMMAVKVVGFLPKEYAGVMLLPYEVTTQFGADFDFDKIFFIARDGRNIKGNVESYKFIDGVDKVEERFILYKEYNKDGSIKLEDFSKLSIVEQNIKPARNNKLLDNYIQLITANKMLESLITPSGPGPIADVAKELEEKSIKKKSNNYFTALSQVDLKDLYHKISRLKGIAALQVSGHAWATEGNLNIKTKEVKPGVFEEIGLKVKKGNTIEIRKNLNQIKSDNNTKIVEELSAMMAVILDAVKTPEMLPSIGITEKTLPFWSYITRLGLGADVASRITAQPAIKDLSTALEDNDRQIKGKDFKKKDLNTVIGDYKALYNKEFEKTIAKISENTSEAYEQLKNEFLDKNTLNDIQENDIIDLNNLKQFIGITLEDLSNSKIFDTIKLHNNPKAFETLPEYKKLKFLQLQLALLNTYEKNEPVMSELGQLNNLFSINKETGPNFEDVNGKLELYKALTSETTKIEGIGELLNSDAIKPYIDVVQAQYEVMAQHYNFASDYFNVIKNTVAQKVYGKLDVNLTRLPSDVRDTINGFVQAFLDAETTFKDIYINENRISEKEFVQDMTMLTSDNVHPNAEFKVFGGKKIPVNIQEKLKQMTLFKLLGTSYIKNSDVRVIAIKGNGKIELNQKELIINDLLTLWNEPSGIYKPLVKRLVEHSFMNTGFFGGFSSYAAYIDPSILQDLKLTENRSNLRKDVLKNTPSEEKVDQIIKQLFQHFSKKFTKAYDNDNELFTVLDDGKTLILNTDSKDPRLKEIYKLNDKKQIITKVEYVRFRLNQEYTPLYEFDELSYRSSGQLTYRQLDLAGQPGKNLEINPFGEIKTKFPNNKYEKMEIKSKEVKPKQLESLPQQESEDIDDNSDSLYEGYNEIKPTNQDVIEESINLENLNKSSNLTEIINSEITKNKPKGLPPINRSTNNCS